MQNAAKAYGLGNFSRQTTNGEKYTLKRKIVRATELVKAELLAKYYKTKT